MGRRNSISVTKKIQSRRLSMYIQRKKLNDTVGAMMDLKEPSYVSKS